MPVSARSPTSKFSNAVLPAPSKSDVIRSQRVAEPTSSPAQRRRPGQEEEDDDGDEEDDDDDDDDDDDEDDEDEDEDDDDEDEYHVTERPSIPRSHTPGHLATKSQDNQGKPTELSLRQRSQSASQPSLQLQSSRTPVPSSKTPVPSPSSTPRPPRSYAPNGNTRDNANEEPKGGDSASPIEREPSRRPAALRSTSAITSKPSTLSASVSAASASRNPGGNASRSSSNNNSAARGGTGPRGKYTAFPPLLDPKTAPDVPPAPASGMYWSRAPTSGVPHTALRAHTTTLVGSNIFVFGGCDSRACFNELYVLDADAFHWSAPHVVGEVPVPLRAMTCTPVGKKLVVFGGGDGPAYYNDVYVLDTTNFRWSRPRIVGDRAPSKRRAHTACLYKNGIYVFGGGDGVRALNDVWRLDVSDTSKMSWRLVSGPERDRDKTASGGRDTVPRPKARGYHTANMVGSKLIIYGGSDGGECFNDVWVYDVDAQFWKSVNIPVTYRRLSHTATIVGSYLFIIGGHDGNEYSNEVLLLNLVTMTWDRRKVYGLPPSGRGYHGTVLYDSRLFVIGGFDGSEVFGDVWMLELAVHAYYSQISHFTIEV